MPCAVTIRGSKKSGYKVRVKRGRGYIQSGIVPTRAKARMVADAFREGKK